MKGFLGAVQVQLARHDCQGERRRSLDTLKAPNELHLDAVGDPEILTRISQYELAYRMQTSVLEVMDIAREPKEVHELYGTKPGQKAFSNNCLLARRLVEAGVRFVQLYHWGWDSHGESMGNDLRYGLVDRCKETDQTAPALIKDLKRRGLLDSTLIVWGGEFGGTPMNEERNGLGHVVPTSELKLPRLAAAGCLRARRSHGRASDETSGYPGRPGTATSLAFVLRAA